ncbi:MAG: alpha/beta fold hydrolase [Acidimicrobiia bacterium]|nr:alpha/beta fold hydrolase [Acidimicrobiia bacterium]
MSLGSAITLMVERLVDPVEGMHRAIASRWFGAVGSPGKPVQTVHDTTSGIVYESIRLAGTAVGLGLDAAVTVRPATVDKVQAITNGLWGDRLGRHAHQLDLEMSLRDGNGEVIDAARVAATAPTGHLVVLVHGLVNTERCWDGAASEPGLLAALNGNDDLTPLTLRYNTGRSIADNGRLLASLLEDLHRHWPEPVESISFVGHSMGGLVASTACSTAFAEDHIWVNDVTNVVTLGSPYLGAPLERLTNAVAQGLNVAQETRPLSEFLDRRSRGIKDLDSPTELSNAELPPSIQHHLVAGVFTSDPEHPVGAALGDLMVRVRSAVAGRSLESDDVVVFGGVTHSELTRSPAVIDHVVSRLGPSA